MKKDYMLLFVILTTLAITSCTSQKRLTYFNNINANSAEAINSQTVFSNETKIVAGDKLGITVSASDPATVATFNLPYVSFMSPGSEQIYGGSTLQSYIVAPDGSIEFPTLGKLDIGGLTRVEAINLIEKKLEPYVQDPLVNIQFLNFKVSVMGEVLRPGNYQIINEKTTILDALALAGDLTAFARRDDVMIVRENNGKIEFGKINLNDGSIFTSPYYYVKQNDAIYVKPNGVKSVSSQNIPLYLSSASTLATLVTLAYSIYNTSRNTTK